MKTTSKRVKEREMKLGTRFSQKANAPDFGEFERLVTVCCGKTVIENCEAVHGRAFHILLVRFLRTVGICVFIVWTILGYQSSEIFQEYGHIVSYLVYVLMMACWQFASFIIIKSTASKVLTFMMALVELYIFRLVFKFMQLLKQFSEEELQLLRILENPQRNVWWHQTAGPPQATQQVVIVPAQAATAQRPPMYH